MPRTRPAYPAEFRHQMVELVRAGPSPDELAEEFEPSGQSIREWVRKADLDDGRGEDGLNGAEREELKRLSVAICKACNGNVYPTVDAVQVVFEQHKGR